MPRRKRFKTTFDYLAHAEMTLFPNLPYHFLTKEQREQAYELTKELLRTKEGIDIP